jgi:hypothetical protein
MIRGTGRSPVEVGVDQRVDKANVSTHPGYSANQASFIIEK